MVTICLCLAGVVGATDLLREGRERAERYARCDRPRAEYRKYEAMTAPRLLRIHEILMSGQDDEYAGKLRTSAARVGSVVFCPPEEVPDEWWTFWAMFPHVPRVILTEN